MFCESYRESLSNAAIFSEALTRGQQAHLEVCPSCRAALAEERALADSIDAGLHALVNPEVPASLMLSVRGKIDTAPALAATWRIPSLVFASAAMALGIGFFLFRTQPKVNDPSAGTVAAHIEPVVATPALRPAPPLVPLASASVRLGRSLVATGTAATALPSFESEVLVSPEEQINLQKYLASRRSAGVATGKELTMRSDPHEEIAKLEIAQLEFGQLNIEPLSSGDSQ